MCGAWGGGGRDRAQIQGPGAQKPLSQNVTLKPQPGLTLQLPVKYEWACPAGCDFCGLCPHYTGPISHPPAHSSCNLLLPLPLQPECSSEWKRLPDLRCQAVKNVETWGEGAVIYRVWGPAFYLYFVLWGWGWGYRESGIFLSVSSNALSLYGLWRE